MAESRLRETEVTENFAVEKGFHLSKIKGIQRLIFKEDQKMDQKETPNLKGLLENLFGQK